MSAKHLLSVNLLGTGKFRNNFESIDLSLGLIQFEIEHGPCSIVEYLQGWLHSKIIIGGQAA